MRHFVRFVIGALVITALYRSGVWLQHLVIGDLAANQFVNSDDVYWQNNAKIMIIHWALYFAVAFIAWIAWFRPILHWSRQQNWAEHQSKVAKFFGSFGGIVLLLTAIGSSQPAYAYYDTTDRPEPVMIMPNETAFWIKDVGDVLNGQANTNTEEFYEKNRVQVRRFNILHVKLDKSSCGSAVVCFGFDSYVPAGRLIIVPLEPYNTTWTASPHTGTSARDQSITCQSKEGLNIMAQFTVGAHIDEKNAARYLAHSRVLNPAGDRTTPQVIFTSTYRAEELGSRMDTVIWGYVSTVFCDELNNRPFLQANAESSQIRKNLEDKTRKYAETLGITIDYLGYAGTWTFDKPVQDSINIAIQAEVIKPQLEVIKWQTFFEVARKWDGKMALPSFVVIPEGFLNSSEAKEILRRLQSGAVPPKSQ